MRKRLTLAVYFQSTRDVELLKRIKEFSKEQNLSVSRGLIQFIRMLRDQLDFAIEETRIYEILLTIEDPEERERIRLGYMHAREVREEKRKAKYKW